jgi:hypothetical protein
LAEPGSATLAGVDHQETRKSRYLYGLGLVLGSAFFSPGTARAQPPSGSGLPVAVVAVQADAADDQADALTISLRNRVRTMKGYSLVEGDWSLEVLALALQCGDDIDATCETKIADQLHADRYLWVKMKHPRATKRVTADVHLWVRGRPGARTQLSYSDNLTAPGDDALRQIVDGALAKMFSEVFRGTLEVKAPGVAAGDVYVDGQPAGIVRAGAGAIQVQPGEHRVELRVGSSTQATTVQVAPEAKTDVAFGATAVQEPKAPPALSPAAAVSAAPREPSRPVSLRASAGFTGVGLGAVLVGAGVYSVVRIHQIDTDQGFSAYRSGFGPNADVCNRADMGTVSSARGAASPSDVSRLCSQAATFEALQYVFFGLGALSTAGGVYLLVSDRKHEPRAGSPPGWTVASELWRSGALLEARHAF